MIVINTEVMSTMQPDADLFRAGRRYKFHMEGKWIAAKMENSAGSTEKCASYYSNTAGDYAQYTPYNLEAGWYDISFWNIKYQTNQNPVKMTGTVYANGETVTNIPLGVSEATVDRRGAWTKVGTFYFSGTNDEYFRLVASGGDFARPSDVKFELKASEKGKEKKQKEVVQLIQTVDGNCVLIYFHTPAIVYTQKQKLKVQAETCIIYQNASPCYFEGDGKPLQYDRLEMQDDVTELMNKAGLEYETPYCLSKTDFVTDIIRKIKNEMVQSDIFKKEITDLLVQELFFRISKEHITKSFPTLTDTIHSRLVFVKNEMSEKYQEKWTVERMAKKAYMSTPYFYILYKSRFGISPKRDLQQVRIEQAKNLLLQKKLSVKEIAVAVGYENEYYFIRKFKEQTGITPGKYKKGM